MTTPKITLPPLPPPDFIDKSIPHAPYPWWNDGSMHAYSAATLAQMQAEIADLQREIGGWMLACNEDRDELAAAKEMLRKARSYLALLIELEYANMYEDLCNRIDAFLQEKP